MGRTYNVTTEDVGATAASLAQGKANVEQALDAMTRQVQAVVGGSWGGDASAAFAGLHGRWTKEVADLKELLGEISYTVQTAGVDYEDTEQRALGAFGRFGL